MRRFQPFAQERHGGKLMQKVLTLTATLLLAATLGFAQDTTQNPSTSSPQQNPQQSMPAATPSDQTQNMSITGCLNGSEGNYTLTDQTGTTYQLTGATSDLKQHVGHKVQLMGSVASSNTSASTPPSAGQTQSPSSSGKTFNVASVKHMADTCKPSPPSELGSGVSAAPASSNATGATSGSIASLTNPNGATPENPPLNSAAQQQSQQQSQQPSQTTPPPQSQPPSAATAPSTNPSGSTSSISEQPQSQTSTSQSSTTTKSKSKKNKKQKKDKTTNPPSDTTTTNPPSSSNVPPPQL
jgi:hypothetical protein